MVLNEKTSIKFDAYGYGIDFQEKIIQALLTDQKWAEQIYEVLNLKYFEKKYLIYLAEKYFEYYDKYKCFPTAKMLVSIIKKDFKERNDEIIKKQIVDFFYRMKQNPNVNDLPYVKEKILDFCRRQALKEALEKSVDLIEEENYEGIVGVIKDALSKGEGTDLGTDFFNDAEKRFEEQNRKIIPTGMVELDKVLNGGVGKGELSCVLAPTSVGKSHFLVMMGANAMRLKKNVVFYTFELSESAVGIRFDSNLTNIPSNEIVKRKKEVIDYYKNNNYGKLIIKSFPIGGASCLTLKNHLDKLKLKGFNADIILCDYADLMNAEGKNFEANRFAVQDIYRGLRNLAKEEEVPIWTASQANRTSSKDDYLTLDAVAESYSKSQIVDFLISISRKPHEEAQELCRFFVAKNRNGVSGRGFSVRADLSKSKFEILSEANLGNLDAIENSDLKKSMKEKWNEFVSKKDKENAIFEKA